MAKREPPDDNAACAKRVKTDAGDNPYLAHWTDGQADHDATSGTGSGLAGFPRHATTSKLAAAAEDGPSNPFTGRPLSSKYLSILRTRRDLPVHQQRWVHPSSGPYDGD